MDTRKSSQDKPEMENERQRRKLKPTAKVVNLKMTKRRKSPKKTRNTYTVIEAPNLILI